MKALVDRVLPIFPFEEPLYRDEGIDVRFVGHPLVDLVAVRESREQLAQRLELDPARPIVALLPGSRANELQRLVPVLAAAVPRIASAVHGHTVSRRARAEPSRFVLRAVSRLWRAGPDRRRRHRRRARGERRGDHRLGHRHGADGAARQADGRRLSAVAGHLQAGPTAGARVDVQHGQSGRRRAVVEELIQDECTPEAVAREAVDLLTNAERVADMKEQLGRRAREARRLGRQRRAADAILEVAARSQGR